MCLETGVCRKVSVWLRYKLGHCLVPAISANGVAVDLIFAFVLVLVGQGFEQVAEKCRKSDDTRPHECSLASEKSRTFLNDLNGLERPYWP